MEKRRHKAITNEANPKDHNTRGHHVIKDKKHHGSIPKPIPRMGQMAPRKPIARPTKRG